jgi:uncharacterized protein
MHLTLSLTHNCNCACTYCYAGSKRAEAMSFAIAKKSIDLAFDGTPEKVQLGFFGGEPLLEWELLKRAADYAREKSAALNIPLQKTLTTNGTLVTDDKMQWLHESGFYVAVSIDGVQAAHDACRPYAGGASSHKDTVRGLEIALAVDPLTEAIMVADPANVAHLCDSVAYLCGEKMVHRLTVSPNFYARWNDGALDLLERQLEAVADLFVNLYRNSTPVSISSIDNKLIARIKGGLACEDHCRFGDQEIAVAASGRIYPCERLIGNDKGDGLCIGTIDNGLNTEFLHPLLARRGRANPECKTCAIEKVCQSRCGCVNYALTGDIGLTGGIVCFYERITAAAADRAGGILYEEGNPHFLKRFYYEDFEEGEELVD